MSGKMKWSSRNPFAPHGSRSDGKRLSDFHQRDRVLGNQYVARVEVHIQELEAIVAAEKAKPCHDCNTSYSPWVMQFDHLDGNEKRFNISQFRSLMPSAEVLREEIAKCELVCANCHAERTHQRSEAARAEKERLTELKRQHRLRNATPPK